MTVFKLEKDMTPIVRKWMEDIGYLVRAEMGSANICDIIGCFFDMTNVAKRIALKEKTPLTWRYFDPVVEDPKSLLGFTSVKPVRRPWMPLHKSIVAVELKLSRISDVVSQAKVHNHYVHQSYIAMPMAVAERALDRAVDVGVLGVYESGVTILKAAPSSEPKDEWYAHKIAEVFWRYHRKELSI